MPPALGGQNLNPQTTREMPSSLVSKTVPPPDLLLFSACPISVSLSPGESFALRFIHRSVIHSRDFNCRHLLRIHLCLQYRLFLKPQTPVNRCLLNISRLCTNPALTELTNPGVLGASLDVQCLSPSPPPAGTPLPAGPPVSPRALGTRVMVLAISWSRLCPGFPVPSV